MLDALWKKKPRKYTKFKLFSHLLIQMFFIDFKAKVYDLKPGNTLSFDEVASQINSVCFVDLI